MTLLTTTQQQLFYGPLIQNYPSEPVLSQDLLEQPLDFYEPDVLLAIQPIMSKYYRKTPSGLVVFCFIDMASAAPHV